MLPDTSVFSFFAYGTDEIFSDPLGTLVASFGPQGYRGTFDCGVLGCSLLAASLNFLGSGGGDRYAFMGSINLTEVPSRVPELEALAPPAARTRRTRSSAPTTLRRDASALIGSDDHCPGRETMTRNSA